MYFLSNATLTYTVTTSTPSGFNSITGEPEFTTDTTTESLIISLEQKDTKSQIPPLPGIDKHSVYCEGRLVSPATFPSWYKDGLYVDITWDTGKTGKFYILPTISSRFGLESCFGQPIKGWLVLSN